jgi:hypothetical protein
MNSQATGERETKPISSFPLTPRLSHVPSLILINRIEITGCSSD